VNLLSELQGLSGENLCSATLRLLLIRSQDLRNSFVDLLSSKNNLGPITLGSHFSCTLEEPTVEESGNCGRLDLLLEVSDAVIGIENKLNAGFQNGQPHKYLKTVADRASGLSNLRKKLYTPIVAILAPESRKKEIEEVIGTSKSFVFLSWEVVRANLSHAAADLDAPTDVIMRALFSYVYQQTSLFPEWPSLGSRLGRWQIPDSGRGD